MHCPHVSVHSVARRGSQTVPSGGTATTPATANETLLWSYVAVAALLVLGTWLALTDVPFHEDEAIYAAWAQTILTDDPFLRITPVDKPPLFFYALATTFRWFGVTATVARLTNVALMALVVVLTARLSRRPARAAALLVAMPLTVFYAASGFTDPLMLVFILAGWHAARRGWGGATGLACACALLTKPTALLLWPIVVVTAWEQRQIRMVRPFVVGLALPLAIAWAWDVSRLVPSWWQLGRQAYGTLWQPAFAQALGWWKPAALGLGFGWLGLRATRWRRKQLVPSAVAALILLWIPIHVLLGLQPWDRYLLPLAPLLAWLAAERLPMRHAGVLVVGNFAIVLVLLLTPTPGLAGRDGRWIGIEDMAAYLHTLPDDAVIYHREMGRPLAFYAPALKNRLVWLPVGEAPPPGAWWAGRLDDAECRQPAWTGGASLALCRTE